MDEERSVFAKALIKINDNTPVEQFYIKGGKEFSFSGYPLTTENISQDDIDLICRELGWEYMIMWNREGLWDYHIRRIIDRGTLNVYSADHLCKNKLDAAKNALIDITEAMFGKL